MTGLYDNQSLARGLKILECLAEAGAAMPVAEVARRTGLHRATVHRTLTVLLQMGYVHKNPDGALYSTAFYLHTFGYLGNIIDVITRHAHRFIVQLSLDVGGVVHLAALEGTQIVYCDRAAAALLAPPAGVLLGTEIGARRDAHATALGKVLMAYRPEEEIRRRYEDYVLSARTRRTIRGREQLIQSLAAIRRTGWALENEEYRTGQRSIAAAIVNPAGRATCAVSIDGPASQLTDRALPALTERLLATTRAVAAYMVHSDRIAAHLRQNGRAMNGHAPRIEMGGSATEGNAD